MSFFFAHADRSFQPTQTPNNVLWLDASDTTTITDTTGDVTVWADKSGNGYNADTPTGTPRTGVSTDNGLNIIDFAGAEYLTLPSALHSIPNGNNTLFVVAKRTSEDISIDATIGAATGATNEYFHINAATAGAQSFTNKSGGGGTVSATGNTNTSLYVAEMYRNGTQQSIRVNGGSPTTNTSATSSATIDSFLVGAAGGAGFKLNGSLAEILIYNRALGDGELSTVRIYLANKWGVTLA